MLTKNGRLYLVKVANQSNKQYKAEDGSLSSVSDNTFNNNFINATYGGNIEFGTGTTLPTSDDYSLETPLDNSLPTVIVSRSATNSGTAITYSDIPSILYVTVLVTNETGNDISVTEIGMCCYNGTASSSKKVLLSRTVLTEPITFESGKTYQITVAIN